MTDVNGLRPPMILYTYNPWLVLLSVVVSLMASFIGLSMTKGLSSQSIGQRQARITLASIALGGGIWAMHFVAILAMQFDVPVFFEVAETVASALIAILLAGLSLLIMHFGSRSRWQIVLSGGILGAGIVAMHLVGLRAFDGCLPVYSLGSVVLAGALAMALGVLAIWVAYGRRTERNILLATVIFGVAVAAVHFSAMAQTSFLAQASPVTAAPELSNSQVAVLLMLPVFVIFGGFLLVGAGVMTRLRAAIGPAEAPAALVMEPVVEPAPPPPHDPAQRLPYERDGKTHLVPFSAVRALRAEGHYTTAFLEEGAVFCPWSITLAEGRVPPGFMRVHRSWLVNLAHVTAFARDRDQGICQIAGAAELDRIPVSRARIAGLKAALGL